MAEDKSSEDKPKRLQFKTYLGLINNSVGSSMFRNWYVKTSQQGEFDAMKDGEDSCAFYVSSVLVMFGKIARIHGTVDSTVKDLKKSGWSEVTEAKEGDVLVWEAQKFDDHTQNHIGFYVGNNQAISTSMKEKTVVRHDKEFGDKRRKIEHVFRQVKWDDQS